MKMEEHSEELNPLNNTKTFKSFFNDFFPVLTIFAKKYVKDNGAAHDIAQEGFISVWEKKASFKSGDDVRFYLYTIVRNKCLNYLKHEKVKQEHREHILNEELNYFVATTIEQEVFMMLHTAVKELAPKTQEIINLSLQGLGNKEIAEQLNISLNTVKTLKRRSFQRLNVQLKEYFYLFFL